ncbi:hypothetical protein K437DRAFT_262815 [Tilletiaria anomala UBC 951]|uniref:CID domain-containing protein n=1 Tax=Tilletiaria anomala (strain ATCC 24038 / CBS 436.72 / UBC 951) TaxID=1037660 RepID=A0A066VW15_TILAU|nr:uncharacterized protein K437DRAFT_262815 [Tilletiaria anomala UBC 951]KDN45882.1 hypothetical protein K437DRAFT_262815 [Tilletiaria anomala UBC 951]
MTELNALVKIFDDINTTGKLSSSAVDKAKKLSEACYNDPLPMTGAILKAHLRATPKSALSSFYIFDAIARQAHDYVRKAAKGEASISGANSSAARACLQNLEGIAAEMTLTTLNQVSDSHLEKVKKVVDIWTKASTFSDDILQVIRDLVAQEPTSPKVVSGAQSAEAPQQPPVSSAAAAGGLPASLAALLGTPSLSQQTGSEVASTTPTQSAQDLLTSLSSLINQPAATSATSTASSFVPPQLAAHSAAGSSIPGSGHEAESSRSFPNVPSVPQRAEAWDAPHGAPFDSHHRDFSGPAGWPAKSQTSSAWDASFGSARARQPRDHPSSGASRRRSASPDAARMRQTSHGSAADRGVHSSAPKARTPPRYSDYVVGGSAAEGSASASESGGASGSAGAQPKPDPSVGDLSSFDPTNFDPTSAEGLDRLAKMYQNTYGRSATSVILMATSIFTR